MSITATSGVVFDIETRAHPRLKEWLGIDEKIDRLEGKSKEQLVLYAESQGIKIGRMVDPEKIRAKIEDHYLSLASKGAVKDFGCVISSIAAKDVRGAGDDLDWIREGKDLADRPGYEPPRVWTVNDEHDEEAVVSAFFKFLYASDYPVLMGFNIRGSKSWSKGFDIPKLRIRAAMLDITWPSYLPSSFKEDRYSNALWDVCDLVSEGSCDDWLRMAGLPVKTASGASAATMTPEELSAYNANDVELERLLAAVFLPTQSIELNSLLEHV